MKSQFENPEKNIDALLRKEIEKLQENLAEYAENISQLGQIIEA